MDITVWPKPKGAHTKLRVLVLISIIVPAGLAAIAQNSAAPSVAFSSIMPEEIGPHLMSEPALPDNRRFTPPPDTASESSSRAPAEKVKADALPPSAGPATTDLSLIETPCDKPAELFSAREYSGPLQRLAAWFSRNPEITTVPAHRRNGQRICGLNARQKFKMFAETTIDPVTFVGAGASAGFSQWQNDDSSWGQGAEGYGKRYAAAFTDSTASNFFGQFLYPVIFRQDPRYYRKGNGDTGARMGHALAHTFVTRSDAGNSAPNYSLWATTASTVALANLYHPGNDRGFPPAATRVGISIGEAMANNLLKEFWPEIVHKLRLPFRNRPVVPAVTAADRNTPAPLQELTTHSNSTSALR